MTLLRNIQADYAPGSEFTVVLTGGIPVPCTVMAVNEREFERVIKVGALGTVIVDARAEGDFFLHEVRTALESKMGFSDRSELQQVVELVMRLGIQNSGSLEKAGNPTAGYEAIRKLTGQDGLIFDEFQAAARTALYEVVAALDVLNKLGLSLDSLSFQLIDELTKNSESDLEIMLRQKYMEYRKRKAAGDQITPPVYIPPAKDDKVDSVDQANEASEETHHEN